MKMPKSYWMRVSSNGERAQAAIKSWLSPLCDDMTVEKAEILCDTETNREKKIRAYVVDAAGKKFVAERTRGGRQFSINLKPA